MEHNDIEYLVDEFPNDEFPEIERTVNDDQDEQRQQHDEEW